MTVARAVLRGWAARPEGAPLRPRCAQPRRIERRAWPAAATREPASVAQVRHKLQSRLPRAVVTLSPGQLLKRSMTDAEQGSRRSAPWLDRAHRRRGD